MGIMNTLSRAIPFPPNARGLKVRLIVLVLGLFVPLALAFSLVTNAHDYFLYLKRFPDLPLLTSQFAFPVMGAGPRGHDAFHASHSLVFYLFWLPLVLGPLAISLAILQSTERARVFEIAFQGLLTYFLLATTLFVLLIIGILAPFF